MSGRVAVDEFPGVLQEDDSDGVGEVVFAEKGFRFFDIDEAIEGSLRAGGAAEGAVEAHRAGFLEGVGEPLVGVVAVDVFGGEVAFAGVEVAEGDGEEAVAFGGDEPVVVVDFFKVEEAGGFALDGRSAAVVDGFWFRGGDKEDDGPDEDEEGEKEEFGFHGNGWWGLIGGGVEGVGFCVDLADDVGPGGEFFFEGIEEAVLVAGGIAAFGSVPLLEVAAMMPADDVRSGHHALEGFTVELGDFFDALRSGAEAFHAPFFLLGLGEAEAAVAIEDGLAGGLVDFVGELHVVGPEAVGLDGDDIDVLLGGGENPIVVPHRHVFIAEEEMIRVFLEDDFAMNAIPFVGDEMEEGDHVGVGLFAVGGLGPVGAVGQSFRAWGSCRGWRGFG